MVRVRHKVRRAGRAPGRPGGKALTGGALYVCATLLAIAIVRRLFGSLSAWDALVPFILLSALLADGAASTPNLALGAGPFLLLPGLAGAFLVEPLTARLSLVVAIFFCGLYTGFGFLFAFLIPPLLALQLAEAWPRR